MLLAIGGRSVPMQNLVKYSEYCYSTMEVASNSGTLNRYLTRSLAPAPHAYHMGSSHTDSFACLEAAEVKVHICHLKSRCY